MRGWDRLSGGDGGDGVGNGARSCIQELPVGEGAASSSDGHVLQRYLAQYLSSFHLIGRPTAVLDLRLPKAAIHVKLLLNPQLTHQHHSRPL